MIARVTLEMALRKEFDYLIPPGLVQQVDVGSRVQVPFGPRKVMAHEDTMPRIACSRRQAMPRRIPLSRE